MIERHYGITVVRKTDWTIMVTDQSRPFGEYRVQIGKFRVLVFIRAMRAFYKIMKKEKWKQN